MIEYGTSASLGSRQSAVRATYAYETGYISEVRLQGLKPDTRYHYRVGSPDGGWSPVYSFRTAPADPRRIVFTAFGDHGVTKWAAANVQNIVREKPLFHMLLGDVSYANGTQRIWDDYLVQVEPLASQTPFMLALGNHENERMMIDGVRKPIGYVSALARFAMPGAEKWYACDMGPMRLVVFNSDDYRNTEQLQWLEKTLSDARSNPGIQWLVVAQHHPLYGSSKGREDNSGLIKAVQPLFDKYKVDLVLAGHDHHYERQFPMRGGKAVSSHPNAYLKGEGTLYVKGGGGGKGLYEFADPWPALSAMREKTYCYLRITVERDGPLTVEARRLDRSLIEKVVVKQNHQP
jgi:hypothetical protein